MVFLRTGRGGAGEHGADVVVDHHDPAWPVIRRLDLTPDMLGRAREAGRGERAALVLADARRLPIATGRAGVVFAAGLVQHLPDPGAGLAELARVVRPGGRLTIFHPSGRAALAARHGRPLRPGEPLAPEVLPQVLAVNGWRLTSYDDAPERFFASAVRTPPAR